MQITVDMEIHYSVMLVYSRQSNVVKHQAIKHLEFLDDLAWNKYHQELPQLCETN